MLSGYYDRGGQSGADGVTVVAGYVSSVEDWRAFDTEWKAHLAKPEYSVPYFHMKEFAHSRGAFEHGWQGERRKRREFLEGLIGIVQAHAYRGFGSVVQEKVFRRLTADPDVANLFPSAYAYCGRSVIAKATLWAKSSGFALPMQSFFEAGDKGWGGLVRVVKRDGHPEPVRKPKKPTTPAEMMDILTPLQAGDFAAYEILKYYKLARTGDHDWDDVRESFKALAKFPLCEWGIVSEDNVSGFLETVRVAKLALVSAPDTPSG